MRIGNATSTCCREWRRSHSQLQGGCSERKCTASKPTAEAGRKDAERTKDLALSEAADQRRKGVETARGMVLSLDQAVALSAAPGASQVDAAREGLRGYAKSAYADELSDL